MTSDRSRGVRTMPFGRYRGVPIADLPHDYLLWLTTISLRPPLRAAVERELRAREQRARHHHHDARRCPSPDLVEELIGVGFRALARRYHPDAGGTHEQMISLTAAVDWLRARTRELSA